MFCKNCGNEIEDGSKFCGKCGTLQDAPEVNGISSSEEQTIHQQAYNAGTENSPLTSESVTEGTAHQIIGREYIFKNNIPSKFLIDYFIGGNIKCQFQDDMLFIAEEGTLSFNKKKYMFPYDDIRELNFIDRINVLQLITVILAAILGIIFIFIYPFIGLLFLAMAVFGIIKNVPETVLLVNSKSGKSFKIKMKRIKNKKIADRDSFINDLNNMIH